VREPCPVVIAILRDENLRLVLQSPKGRRVHDAVTVALEVRARRTIGFRVKPSACGPGIRRVYRSFAISEPECMSVDRHYPSIRRLPIDAASQHSYLYSQQTAKTEASDVWKLFAVTGLAFMIKAIHISHLKADLIWFSPDLDPGRRKA
jgi:hypothetical protein